MEASWRAKVEVSLANVWTAAVRAVALEGCLDGSLEGILDGSLDGILDSFSSYFHLPTNQMTGRHEDVAHARGRSTEAGALFGRDADAAHARGWRVDAPRWSTEAGALFTTL